MESLIPKKHSPNDSGQSSAYPRDEKKQPDITASQFSDAPAHVDKIPKISGPIFHVEIEKIILNPYQPRKDFDEESLRELGMSIREFGILQPLVVSKTEEVSDSGTRVTYQLIAGQRRLLAAKMIGLNTVPVVIRNALKKTEALEMAIVENIQRADLNNIETARAYARLSDEFGLTQREIAARLGKSREVIANALRLLSLPTEVQEAIAHGRINESQARLLLQIENPQKQMELFEKITKDNLSVRDIKHQINKEAKEEYKSENPTLTAEDIELKQLEKDLSEFLGAPVKVEFSRSGGKIVINFFSPEEARGIAHKIKPESI